MMQQLNDKINKIYNLFKHTTIKGERDAAFDRLKTICEKYNVDINQLELSEKKQRTFRYKTKFQKKLIIHVISKVLDSMDFDLYRYRNQLTIELSDKDFILMSELNDLYQKEWGRIQKIIEMAFFHKHEIYSKTYQESLIQSANENEETGEKELAEIDEILQYIDIMKFVETQKKIESN